MKFVSFNKANSKIYRGPRPKTHADLLHDGIKVRVDLQTGTRERYYNDLLEDEDPMHFGIHLFDYAFSNFSPPGDEHVKNLIKLLENLDGRDVYIHCLHGKDRTGYLIAALRMSQGWSYEAAVKEMFENGFHKFPYLWWLISLKRLAKQYEARKVLK